MTAWPNQRTWRDEIQGLLTDEEFAAEKARILAT